MNIFHWTQLAFCLTLASNFVKADDACQFTPCLNGGTCKTMPSSKYLCICAANFTGTNCQCSSSQPCQTIIRTYGMSDQVKAVLIITSCVGILALFGGLTVVFVLLSKSKKKKNSQKISKIDLEPKKQDFVPFPDDIPYVISQKHGKYSVSSFDQVKRVENSNFKNLYNISEKTTRSTSNLVKP